MRSHRRAVPYVFTHPVFGIWGIHGYAIAIDSMHTIDLGVTSHVLGNALYEFIYEQRRHGQTVKQAVAHVWSRIQAIYDEQNTQYRISFLRLLPSADAYKVLWEGCGENP